MQGDKYKSYNDDGVELFAFLGFSTLFLLFVLDIISIRNRNVKIISYADSKLWGWGLSVVFFYRLFIY